MKKLFILVLFIFTVQFSFAQKVKAPKADKLCKKIKKKIDKFDGKISYHTPHIYGGQMSYIKVITKGIERVYLSISTISISPATGKGVVLLLANGERLTFDEETDVRVNALAEFAHSAFITLSKEDIEKLKDSSITDVRIYIHATKITNPVKYRLLLICLDNMH